MRITTTYPVMLRTSTGMKRFATAQQALSTLEPTYGADGDKKTILGDTLKTVKDVFISDKTKPVQVSEAKTAEKKEMSTGVKIAIVLGAIAVASFITYKIVKSKK